MYEKKVDNDIIWNKIRNKISKILNLGQCPKRIFANPHPLKQLNNQRIITHRGTFYQPKSNLQLSTPMNDVAQGQNTTLKLRQMPSEQAITIDESRVIKHVLSFKSVVLNNGSMVN